MTLTGNISAPRDALSSIQVLQRPAELLPPGLSVNVALDGNNISVMLHNTGRNSVSLDHKTVFAELHSSTGENVDLQTLVGPSLEADIIIENIKASCLIDSSSQVSIISETFYRTNLAHLTGKTECCGSGWFFCTLFGICTGKCLPARCCGC